MKEPLNYNLDHTTATVNLSLTPNRLIAQTRGKGIMDKPVEINIPLSDVKNFCLIPTTKFQNLESVRSKGDYSYDSEFIFSYVITGKIKKKRVFVDSQDQSFIVLINELQRLCPEAYLLHISPVEAMKKIDVVSASGAAKILIGILIGVALIAILLFIYLKG